MPNEDFWNPDHRKKKVGVTRARAEVLLRDLLDRARAINEDPYYLFGVGRIEVFGSYINSDKPKLGDVDLAVGLGPKEPDRDKRRPNGGTRQNRTGASGVS